MEDEVLLVNKPVGMSTYDVVRWFKKQSGYKGKVGHAGTLDVFACGLVILLLGKATKRFAEFGKMEKEYIAGARLGYKSDTLDVEGNLKKQTKVKKPSRAEIKAALEKFIGKIEQQVPAYSAAKNEGKPLYKLARKGIKVEKSKEVVIEKLKLVAYKYPLVSLKVVCSSGTYVRQLVDDVFQSMGVENFLFSLKRTRIGRFSLEEAVECCELR